MRRQSVPVLAAFVLVVGAVAPALAQLIDQTTAPNTAGAGIAKSLTDEIGAGRGDRTTPDSSSFIIARDPFRAIRRGRQLFQRKFTRAQGQGPVVGDGTGDIETDLAIGAGLADSCAGCHGRPRGSAGFGGDVVTRPDSRDAPHLFGLGLKEMLADEITADLRAIRAGAVAEAHRQRPRRSPRRCAARAIDYGTHHRPSRRHRRHVGGRRASTPICACGRFFAHGGTISIREFVVGAFSAEMGLQAVDPDLVAGRSRRPDVTTPSGMVLDGSLDKLEAPPRTDDPATDPDGDGVANEIPTSLVDFMEFYLLNYFKPATGEQTERRRSGPRTLPADRLRRRATCPT